MAAFTSVTARTVVCLFFAALGVWQIILSIQLMAFTKLVRESGLEGGMAGFIAWMQPFAWLLIMVTVILAIDVVRRTEVLVLNAVATVLCAAAGTMLLQALMVVSVHAAIGGMPEAGL